MDFEILHEFPSPKLEEAWRDCLSRVDFPAHYNAPEYFHVPFWAGRRPFAILALENGAVTGVLTGLHLPGEVTCGLVSRPQICVDGTKDANAVVDALLRGLLAEAGSTKLLSVYTWPSLEPPAFAQHRFRRRQLQGNVVLDLTLGPEALFRQFFHDRQRNIRYAEKHGVTVREATTREDIAAAYDVYRGWHKTSRKTVRDENHSFDIFEKASRLTKNRRLFLAEYSGKVIAINTFRFYPGGMFESASNQSLDEFLRLKPNDLLQWRGIQWACAHGLRRHSLGASHEFLRRFGGTIVPIIRYRLDRTWMRTYDLREALRDWGRSTLQKMPASIQARVRRTRGDDTHPTPAGKKGTKA